MKEIISRLILIDLQDHSLLEKFPFAGYILFYKDIDQVNYNSVKDLNNFYLKLYRDKFGFDLFRSIDQEGGVVFRYDYPDFPAIPSQISINSLDSAYKLAKLNGLILNYLGFNINFSPVMDINVNSNNPIIGVRSFGNDPHLVSSFSKQYIKAYSDVGIFSCGKHFPGHGNTDLDSHLDLPNTLISDSDLIPFIENKDILPSIMTSHVVYKNIDSLPATLSLKTLSLFQPYDGIIFSDALNMDALKYYSWEEILVKSLYAGVDVLLVFGNDELKIDTIEILSKLSERDERLQKLILSKYSKVQRFIGNLGKRYFNDDWLLSEISNLRNWMINDFSIKIDYYGDINKFIKEIRRSNDHKQKFNLVLLSSPYIKHIGVNSSVYELMKRILFNFDLSVFEVFNENDFENVLEKIDFNYPVLICYLLMNKNLEFVIDRLSSLTNRIYTISFSNSFLMKEDREILNVYGFSRIHLINFERWVSRIR